MSMYSSIEGTSNLSTVNGIPNVSQYSWTAFEIENYQQLSDYVDACKKYFDDIAATYAHIETLSSSVFAIKIEVDILAALMKKNVADVAKQHSDIDTWHRQIKIWERNISEMYADFDVRQTQVVRIHGEVIAMYTEISRIRDSVLAAETSAWAAEDGARGWFDKSYDLYLELQRGQIYRGIWNPNSSSYPDPKGSNSVWDISLNTGQDSVVFDGKTWFSGERLVYILDTKKYDQITTSTSGVRSINGKVGAVTLDHSDVGALSTTGGVLTGDVISSGLSPKFVLSHTNSPDNVKLFSLSHNSAGNGTFTFSSGTSTASIVTLKAGASGEIYHTGNKPLAGDLNAYTKQEVDAKITDHSYSKLESDTALAEKASVVQLDTAVNLKVDKTTTVNGKSLSANVSLIAGDVGAYTKAEVDAKVPDVSGKVDKTTTVNGKALNADIIISAIDTGGVEVITSTDGTTMTMFTESNPDRDKKIRIYSKDNNFYSVSQDGTVAKFYNDKSYKPTAADFGGLFIEDGNELNFPVGVGESTLHMNYRTKGSEINKIVFHNGKSQLNGYCDIVASEFYAGTGKVYHPGNKPTAKDINALAFDPVRFQDGADFNDAPFNSTSFVYNTALNAPATTPAINLRYTGIDNNYAVDLSGSYSDNKLHYRTCSSGTWNNWHEVLTTEGGSIIGRLAITPTTSFGINIGTSSDGGVGDTILAFQDAGKFYHYFRGKGSTNIETSEGLKLNRGTGLGIDAGSYADINANYPGHIQLAGSGGIGNAGGINGVGFHDDGNTYFWNRKGNTTDYNVIISPNDVTVKKSLTCQSNIIAGKALVVQPQSAGDASAIWLRKAGSSVNNAAITYDQGNKLIIETPSSTHHFESNSIKLDSNLSADGEKNGLVTGRVQIGGDYASWQSRAAGVVIDVPYENDAGAINIAKVTRWGAEHNGAIQLYTSPSDCVMALTLRNNTQHNFQENGNYHMAVGGGGLQRTIASNGDIDGVVWGGWLSAKINVLSDAANIAAKQSKMSSMELHDLRTEVSNLRSEMAELREVLRQLKG